MQTGTEMRNADTPDEPPVWPVGPIFKTRATLPTDDCLLWPDVKTKDDILPDRLSICSAVKTENATLPNKTVLYSVQIDGEDPSSGPQVWHIVKEDDNRGCSDESNGLSLQDQFLAPSSTGECEADVDPTQNHLSQSSVVCALGCDTRTSHTPEKDGTDNMVKTQNEDNPSRAKTDTKISISTTKFPICRYSMHFNRTPKRQACSVQEKLRDDSISNKLTTREMGIETEVQSELSTRNTPVDVSHDSESDDFGVPFVLHRHPFDSPAVLRHSGSLDIHTTQYPSDGCTDKGLKLNDEMQQVVPPSLKVIINRSTAPHPGDDQGQRTAPQAGVRKPYRCELCQKHFSSMDTLRGHYLVHTGARPMTCDVCQKTFNHLSNLRRHKRTHTGVKPYTCSTCGKSFTRLSTLKTHSLTHTEDKPYTCKKCGKRFAEESKLTSHGQTHDGEKPFACVTCGKSFAWLSILKKHSLTHTGLKPYLCLMCGKGFSDPSALKTHGLTHTGERPFTCNVCSKGFTTQYNLTSHGVTHGLQNQATI